MKSARLLAAAFVVCASLPLTMAQQVNSTAQESGSVSAAGTHANESANAGESASANPNSNQGRAEANGSGQSSLMAKREGRGDAAAYGSATGNVAGSAQMRPVTGQLEGKLDSKTAKPGDKVFLKTTEKTKTADGVEIPKGSRLVGHVTEVEAHAKGHEASHMGLQFDRVELKNGQSMAIHSMIQSIQPSAAMAAGSMDDEAALSGPAGGGSAMAGGGARAGGGLLGGAGGAVGRAGSGLESTAGGTVHAAGNLAGDAAGSVGHGLSATTEGVGSLGERASGIPGVMLNGDAAGSASGTLSATNKNIHLDSGTQMVLGVAAAR